MSDRAPILTIEEAMQNVGIAAEMDDPYRVGILDSYHLILQDEKSPEAERSTETTSRVSQPDGVWLTSGSGQDLMELMRCTLLSLIDYLKKLYKNPTTNWEHENTRKGLQSMMVLVGQAGKQVDKALRLLDNDKKKKTKLTGSSEYKILQEFYIDNITEKFQGAPPQGDEAWEEDKEEETPIKDLESIRQDDAYELFYLKDQESRPLFKKHLMNNIKLLFDFSEMSDVPTEDPLLEIATIKDRDLQGSAQQILRSLNAKIRKFYEYKIRLQKNTLIASLNSAVMSLMLASNDQNRAEQTFNKTCLKYFLDFQYFFRKALQSQEYQKMLSYPPAEQEKMSKFLLSFTHQLAYEFFTRSSSIRQEILGYIHRLIRKGKDLAKDHARRPSLWEEFLAENEHVTALLKRYPSGPLFKVLDSLQENEEKDQKFEPLQQENMPFLLFAMKMADKMIHILHLPTPTRQTSLSAAEVSEEFGAFLAFLHEEKQGEKKHLLINLQDRTSWKESVRATLLENLQKRAEYSNNIVVVTLPKDTPFYHQSEEYEQVDEAASFLEILEEQLTHPEDFGFHFGKKAEESAVFFQTLLKALHTEIFAKKKTLTRKERTDFIELLYFFLILKVLQDVSPSTVSFTCKDALDVGAMMSAGFFGFLYLLQKKTLGKKEQDYLRLLIYAPVLMVRERSIDSRRLIRTLSSLDTLEKNITKKGVKNLEEIYGKGFFQKIDPL
ncbi:MAG: hypothetical protein AAGI90_02295 [Chlamydiota bacterium]